MKNLMVISDFIASVAGELDLDEDQTFSVQMAVDEACANVIEHAYGGRADGMLRIACEVVNDEVVVTIHDHGRPFDPRGVLRPDIAAPLEKRPEGGLGLFLMEKLMDSIEFKFNAVEGNVLTMRKGKRHEKPSL